MICENDLFQKTILMCFIYSFALINPYFHISDPQLIMFLTSILYFVNLTIVCEQGGMQEILYFIFLCLHTHACSILFFVLYSFSIFDVIALMIGAVEYKLFVGSLNKQATEKEVEEVCCPLIICHLLGLVFSTLLFSS